MMFSVILLGPADRGFVGEMRGIRNSYAHDEPFSSSDTRRALDTAHRLLKDVSAPQVEEIEKMEMELSRLIYDEQVRNEKRKVSDGLFETQLAGNLKSWRDVVSPHHDVASGTYQQAEFAADLWQVHLGEGSDEYRKPVEFFQRTFLTDSLKKLLDFGCSENLRQRWRPGSATANKFWWGQNPFHVGSLPPLFRCSTF